MAGNATAITQACAGCAAANNLFKQLLPIPTAPSCVLSLQLADDPSKNATTLNHGQREFFKHVVRVQHTMLVVALLAVYAAAVPSPSTPL